MAFYLGQLPPPEIGRFKAELAETIIANFCYPRFFDYRTESLQTRPVDRTKRQEVWLYLSSVDFTAWSRVDLTSTDFPHHIERLFIQFVQRNRSFFGAQGRRRMFDIRQSISACASSLTQRLRAHLSGQQITPLFGSPRPVLSWTMTLLSGRPEPAWEQIMASTLDLQRQIQEWRGEIPPSAGGGAPVAASLASASPTYVNARHAPVEVPQPVGAGRRPSRPMQAPANPMNPAARLDHPFVVAQQPTIPTPPLTAQPGQYGRSTAMPMAGPVAPPPTPQAPVAPNGLKAPVPSPSGSLPAASVVPRRPTGNLVQSAEQHAVARQAGGGTRFRVATSPSPAVTTASPASVSPGSTAFPGRPVEAQQLRNSPLPETIAPTPTGPHPARTTSPAPVHFAAGTAPANNRGQREVFAIGEDDAAIFEEMRRQLVLWLRIEALSAGLDLTGQEGAMQLLEMLRQQAGYDETRLQVVSSLLNLTGQVVKTGTVSVLDYKQALTFHLMHTKRP